MVSSRHSHAAFWTLPFLQQHQVEQSSKQRSNRPTPQRTGVYIIAFVILWLALRYVVEVKITIKWRAGTALAWQRNTHCRNTCFKARDGVCDEGRPHRSPAKQKHQEEQQRLQGMPAGVSAVHCDLGTDCTDCGPWAGQQADESWTERLLPIAYLRARNISVRSRATSTSGAPLSLAVSFTDPEVDWDASKQLQHEGVLEVGTSQVFYQMLSSRCSAAGPGGLVADVGANFGWFSLLAARLGCRVIAWEPVPLFRAFLSHNLAHNHLAQLVTVRPTVVADPPGSKQAVTVPNRGIWGTAGIGGANIDLQSQDVSRPLEQVEVVAESLDEVLAGQHVDMLKVDVEGYEPSVLATARQLLAAGAIDNVMLEYSPGVYERNARWGELAVFPIMLLSLAAANFTLLHMNDEFTKVWAPGRSITNSLPKLQQILPENLKYDVWDAKVFRTGYIDPGASPPFCQAMIELKLDNQGMPERLHPKSFHAMFGHNTNVFATREQKVLQSVLGPPVGLFPLHMPMNASWFSPHEASGGLGLGGIPCKDLAEDMQKQLDDKSKPLSQKDTESIMTVLIGRRCRCTHQLPCEKHAAAAESCAKAGMTPYVDLPG